MKDLLSKHICVTLKRVLLQLECMWKVESRQFKGKLLRQGHKISCSCSDLLILTAKSCWGGVMSIN